MEPTETVPLDPLGSNINYSDSSDVKFSSSCVKV